MFAHPCAQQSFSQSPEGGSHLSARQWGHGVSKMWPIHTVEYYVALKKEGPSDPGCNVAAS